MSGLATSFPSTMCRVNTRQHLKLHPHPQSFSIKNINSILNQNLIIWTIREFAIVCFLTVYTSALSNIRLLYIKIKWFRKKPNSSEQIRRYSFAVPTNFKTFSSIKFYCLQSCVRTFAIVPKGTLILKIIEIRVCLHWKTCCFPFPDFFCMKNSGSLSLSLI